MTACRKIEDYRQAILHVGGDVRLLDSSMEAASVLREIDGLMLTGGDAGAPERSGQKRLPTVESADPRRDDFEIALVGEARRIDLPLLAICRGIRLLNLAYGGTFVQDIPTEIPGALDHHRGAPPHESYSLAHEVWIEKDSLLARVMRDRLSDSDTCETNSRHHHAVGQLGPGLKASATAPDGVIEAIEDPAARFCLGVQWHPENFWRTGEFRSLFEGFAEAAAATRART